MTRNISSVCPECDGNVRLEIRLENCRKCDGLRGLIKCSSENCKFRTVACVSCDLNEFEDPQPKQNEPKSTNFLGNSMLIVVVSVLLVLGCVICMRFSSNGLENMHELEKLKKDFPSQINDTWSHFMSVLEKRTPTVKSIVFLHDGDKRTVDCLTNTLVFLYTKNETIQGKDITFSAAGFEGKDYGFALVHYRSVVEKHRVFVTDLTEVSGNLARIFHSLCDEFSSDIKPSLFIFTLKYDRQTKMLKPLKRAETILKEAWSNLPDNEIFPLISRVTKNVVDVISERSASC